MQPGQEGRRSTASSKKLERDFDLLICGTSFAGLAVAREVTRLTAQRTSGRPRVLLIDRYEIGDRSTSACASPTEWIEAMGCGPSIRQTFDTLTIHTPLGTSQYELPFTFSTFDYRMLCELLYSAAGVQFERATVMGRDGNTIHTDHGDLSGKVVVDCLGWQGVLRRDSRRPLVAPLSRGLEVHPTGSGDLLEVWIDRSVVPAGYAWSFPAKDELRVGVGSYDPTYHVRAPTGRLARRLEVDEVNHKGNWIPHKLSSATEDGVFFVGDSAGHCLPLTAEGIRTAFYFGIACGREIAAVFNERATVDRALRRYEAFCQRHAFAFTWMLRVQRLMPRVHPRLLQLSLRAMNQRRFVNWGFNHYLKVAHPSFAYVVLERA